MPTPQPAVVVNDLYNELIRLPYSEVERAGQIAWQLKGIVNRSPTLVEAAVALLTAHCKLGDAKEANDLTGFILQHTSEIDGPVFDTFVTLLRGLGCFKECLDLGLPKFQAGYHDVIFVGNLVTAALGAGQIDTAIMLLEEADTPAELMSGFKRFAQSETAKFFGDYQRIVQEIVSGRQTECELLPDNEDGDSALVCHIFMRVNHQERRAVEREIDDALVNFNEANDLAPYTHVPGITYLIHDVRAHWPDHIR